METASYAGKYETGAVAPAVRHMVFLDGLRGVAALYVVLQHSVQSGFFGSESPRWLFFLGWGHDAVTVFIVISGFCLALPVVRSGRTLKGGALHFYKRRAFRILPPYYVALALALVASVVLNPAGNGWVEVRTRWFAKAVLLHVVLLHNWFPNVEFAFDGPLWSVAIECQIYVLFPLLVIFWRRFGTIWLVAGTFVAAHAVFGLSHHHGSANYLFEFVLGVWAADLANRAEYRKHLLWALGLALLAFAFYPNKSSATCDVIVGAGSAAFMALCAAGPTRLRGPFSFAPLVWLGGFSYSIYLIHAIILVGYIDFQARFGSSAPHYPAAGYPLFATLGLEIVPAALGLAWLFHLGIERPFMSLHRVRVAGAGGAAAEALVKPR